MHLRRRAFTLLELPVCVGVAAALIVVFLAAHEPYRRLASLQESFNNLREMGAAYASYANENQDRIASFSWVRGVQTPSTFPDLRGPFPTDLDAQSAQFTDIMRRRGPAVAANSPRTLNFVPHARYNHMPLIDFLGVAAPWWPAISPEDANLRRWANNPTGFLQNQTPPQPTVTGPDAVRWVFSSSYTTTVSAFSPDSGNSTTAVGPGASYGTFFIGSSTVWGGRRLDEVALPAQKIQLFDEAQRHFGSRIALFAYPEARVPVLAFDGGTSLRVSRDNDRGFNPQSPTSPGVVIQSYTPQNWQPPVLDNITQVTPGMQWTRDGLRGRDFDR
jgi:type II secretory pathway pseudopilin PulG